MNRRQWKAETKALIVLEGLKGRPVGELCHTHQISQAQYYQWRDQFFSNARGGFETQTLDQRLTHLQRENAQLQTLIGDLTVELKKPDEVWG